MNHAIPLLVAHRGYPNRYPENTLEGITAALQSGAFFVEFDVQLSADAVPVVIHDQNMRRTSGVDLSVMDTGFEELRRYCVGESEHLQNRFENARLPSLQELVELFEAWPQARPVVEIKRSSLNHFGRDTVFKTIRAELESLSERAIIISFDRDIIADFIKLGVYETGWIIDEYSGQSRYLAETLKPDYLLCKEDLLSEDESELWPGPWQWMVYTIDNPQHALNLAQRGVSLVETNAIGEMLKHPLLKQQSCSHDQTL